MTSPGPLDAIDAAIREGAVKALRKRAAAQAAIAGQGALAANEKFPDVLVRSGESAIACRLAVAFATVTEELEAEALP